MLFAPRKIIACEYYEYVSERLQFIGFSVIINYFFLKLLVLSSIIIDGF